MGCGGIRPSEQTRVGRIVCRLGVLRREELEEERRMVNGE